MGTNRTRVHESLSDDGQRAIDDVRLVDVEYEVGVLNDADPVAKR